MRKSAEEPSYIRELSKWREIPVPRASNKAKREIWFRRANAAEFEWRVYRQNRVPCARLFDESTERYPDRPDFLPKTGTFSGPSACVKVEDGWLVGYNRGEWGGSLWWFSPDGKREYKISNHQIVDFIMMPDGIRAIEGLAHMGISEGSVIRITRPTAETRWRASVETRLPFAPYAVSLHHNNDLLITLSDSLVLVGANHKVRTLLIGNPWGGLYPNSSILTLNGQILYIGMRQFVGEFDLRTGRLRFLLPSLPFLNKLTTEEQVNRGLFRRHYLRGKERNEEIACGAVGGNG